MSKLDKIKNWSNLYWNQINRNIGYITIEEQEKIPPPKIEDLEFLREFDPFFGISAHEGRRLQAQALPVFYERGAAND